MIRQIAICIVAMLPVMSLPLALHANMVRDTELESAAIIDGTTSESADYHKFHIR